MLSKTEQTGPEKMVRDRRFTLVKVFVTVTWLLVVAALLVVCLRIWKPWQGSNNVSNPTRAEVKAVPPILQGETEPRLNEYIYEDRYVLEALVPGVDPVPLITVQYDSFAKRGILTLSWTPAEQANADGKKHCVRQEFQKTGFKRTVTLPEGVSTDETAVLKNGILTVTIPRNQGTKKTIVPRKEN